MAPRCDACLDAPATTAWDGEGWTVPVEDGDAIGRYCDACALRVVETQGGAYGEGG